MKKQNRFIIIRKSDIAKCKQILSTMILTKDLSLEVATIRCGSVYLGVVVLHVCEICYVYEGYVGSAVVLYI